MERRSRPVIIHSIHKVKLLLEPNSSPLNEQWEDLVNRISKQRVKDTVETILIKRCQKIARSLRLLQCNKCLEEQAGNRTTSHRQVGLEFHRFEQVSHGHMEKDFFNQLTYRVHLAQGQTSTTKTSKGVYRMLVLPRAISLLLL